MGTTNVSESFGGHFSKSDLYFVEKSQKVQINKKKENSIPIL